MYYGAKPKIYAENADTFNNNGLGFLPDGQYCYVKEKLNGGLELEMSYPITGAGFEALKINATILCPVNPYEDWQPFRIYSITRQQSGFVKVNAEHKAYELSGYPCLPNDNYIEIPGSCSQLMQYLESEAARTAQALGNPAYTFETDIVKSVNWSIQAPTDIWSVMANAVEWYGGEWLYDGTTCRLCERRGEDRGVKVQYASNLAGLTQGEVDTSYTHIMPYWTDGTTTVYINGYITIAAHTEARMQKHVLILDMSDDFDTEPTQQELYDAAVAWEQEDKNKPKGIEKTLKVNFVPRGQTIEYASLGDIDHVELGDDIETASSLLGVSGKQRCIALTYDVYRGMYREAELGKPEETLATAEIKQSKGQRDKTVWVSVTEPTEGFISGDYWIKINNTTDRIAQGLGRYTGGKWLLLCDFGGSGGVGEDIGNHSERFNDYTDNEQTAQDSYLHIEGKNNKALGGSQGGNYCTSIGGEGNRTENSKWCNIHGYSNEVIYTYYSTITGDSNTVNSCSWLVVSGSNNDVSSCNGAMIGGQHNTVYGSDSSIIFGEYNDINDCDYGIIVGRNNDVDYSHYCIVAGHDNSVLSSSDGLVVGEGNVMTANWCGIFGKYGETDTNDRLVVSNGTDAQNLQKTFYVTDTGDVWGKAWHNTGSDIAEYFEWTDGNPNNEDRCGMLVSLQGDKIKLANTNDIFGAISAKASVIGNDDNGVWRGKYKTDIYGRRVKDEAGNDVLSDEYDPKQKYIPRSQRQEWAVVGVLGRVIIRDNGKCVPDGYVTGRNGIGYPTLAETKALCLKRLDDNHILVWIGG